VQKKVETDEKMFCITRVRLFSSQTKFALEYGRKTLESNSTGKGFAFKTSCTRDKVINCTWPARCFIGFRARLSLFGFFSAEFLSGKREWISCN